MVNVWGHFWHNWACTHNRDIFGYIWGRGATAISLGETRDAAKPSAKHRTAPMTKYDLVQKVNSTKLKNPALKTQRRPVAGGQLEDNGETTSKAGDWQGCGQCLPFMAKQSAVAAKPLCQTPTYQEYNSHRQTKHVSKQGRPLWQRVYITTRSAQEISCNAQLKLFSTF